MTRKVANTLVAGATAFAVAFPPSPQLQLPILSADLVASSATPFLSRRTKRLTRSEPSSAPKARIR